MTDILYILVNTVRYILSLGIFAFIPILFVLALLKKLPWVIAAPGMALVAFMLAYPIGMLIGIDKERAAWEIEIAKLKADRDARDHLADQALLAIEKKYLQEQQEKTQLRQLHSDELDRLFDQSQQRISTKPESRKDGSKICTVCNPYAMRVDPDILRNIQKR